MPRAIGRVLYESACLPLHLQFLILYDGFVQTPSNDRNSSVYFPNDGIMKGLCSICVKGSLKCLHCFDLPCHKQFQFLTTRDLAVQDIKPSKGIWIYLLTRNMQTSLFFFFLCNCIPVPTSRNRWHIFFINIKQGQAIWWQHEKRRLFLHGPNAENCPLSIGLLDF